MNIRLQFHILNKLEEIRDTHLFDRGVVLLLT